MTDFDWDAARSFLAARREGSFAAAARKLGVKHTTVSRRVDALERALGAKLFRRTRDGLMPTAAGEAATSRAEEMERAARQLAASMDDRAAGTVRLALTEAFTEFVVGSLKALSPQLVIELLVSDARADLVRDEADLAIRMGPLSEQSLICTRLASFGWSLYGKGRDFIGFDATLAHSPGAKWLEAHADARIVMRCNSLMAAKHAALAGLGVAPLPCFLGTGLRRVTPEVIGRRDGYLVLHRDRQANPRVRAVASHLRRLVAKHRALVQG